MFGWKKTAPRKLLRTVGYKRKGREGGRVDGEIERDRKREKRYTIREVLVKIR